MQSVTESQQIYFFLRIIFKGCHVGTLVNRSFQYCETVLIKREGKILCISLCSEVYKREIKWNLELVNNHVVFSLFNTLILLACFMHGREFQFNFSQYEDNINVFIMSRLHTLTQIILILTLFFQPTNLFEDMLKTSHYVILDDSIC